MEWFIDIYSHSSRGAKSKTKVLAGHALKVSGTKAALPFLGSSGCQQPLALLGLQPHHSTFCLRLCMAVFPLCVSLFSLLIRTSVIE